MRRAICWSCGSYTGERAYWVVLDTQGQERTEPVCGKCRRQTTLRFRPVRRVTRQRGRR
jgi:hypothetical protein